MRIPLMDNPKHRNRTGDKAAKKSPAQGMSAADGSATNGSDALSANAISIPAGMNSCMRPEICATDGSITIEPSEITANIVSIPAGWNAIDPSTIGVSKIAANAASALAGINTTDTSTINNSNTAGTSGIQIVIKSRADTTGKKGDIQPHKRSCPFGSLAKTAIPCELKNTRTANSLDTHNIINESDKTLTLPDLADIKSINRYIKAVIPVFNEKTKNEVCRIMETSLISLLEHHDYDSESDIYKRSENNNEDIFINNRGNEFIDNKERTTNGKDMLELLNILKELIFTPFYHFIKNPVQIFLLRILTLNPQRPGHRTDSAHKESGIVDSAFSNTIIDSAANNVIVDDTDSSIIAANSINKKTYHSPLSHNTKELKLHAFQLLIENYSPVETFHSLVSQYPSLDTFRIAGSSFRNYCLLTCLTRALSLDLLCNEGGSTRNRSIEDKEDSVINNSIENKEDSINKGRAGKYNKTIKGKDMNSISNKSIGSFSSCAQSISHCPPFVEFLTRSLENPVCPYFLALICYNFLGTVKEDLLSLECFPSKKANAKVNTKEDIKEDENFVISKIFVIFPEIKNKICSTAVTVSETPLIAACKTLLSVLFSCPSLRTISISVYKRLFFYFLHKNRRLFQTGRVLDVFSQEEKCFIYKRVSGPTGVGTALINIFKQIGQPFLLKAALNQSIHSNSIRNDVKDSNRDNKADNLENTPCTNPDTCQGLTPLITAIIQDKLDTQDIAAFYSLYFSFLEKTREKFTLKVFNPLVFCQIFNWRLDKSFTRYLEIEWTLPSGWEKERGSLEILRFLSFYSGEHKKDINTEDIGGMNKKNRSSQFNTENRTSLLNTESVSISFGKESSTSSIKAVSKIVDPVFLVSLLVDLAGSSNKNRNIKEICEILNNTAGLLNIPLVKRLVPVLRRLILQKDLVLPAGRLYFSIYRAFDMIDSIFTRDLNSSSIGINSTNSSIDGKRKDLFDRASILPLKAALNHTAFQPSFTSLYDDFYSTEDDCDKTVEFLITRSLVFYLYHNPSFSFRFPTILRGCLLCKNENTGLFLEYLRVALRTDAFESNGVNSPVSLDSFVVESLPLLYSLYFHFSINRCIDNNDNIGECSIDNTEFNQVEDKKGIRSCRKVVGFPYKEAIVEILFEALRMKIVLPCMVIPYILTQSDCYFIYKNNLESCLNCLNDCLYVTSGAIREAIRCISDNNRDVRENEKDRDNKSENDDSNNEVDNTHEIDANGTTSGKGNTVDEDLLNSIFRSKMKNNFLLSLKTRIPMFKILEKIDYKEDILNVFVVLRFLRDFVKSEKNAVFSHVLESVSDERILGLVEKSRNFYKRNTRGELPLYFIE